MTPTDLLIKAHSLIEDPTHWTQEAPAVMANGEMCAVNEPEAVCFCSIGALWRVGGMEPLDDSYDTSYYLLSEAMDGNVANFNDTHTHAEVMARWAIAIEASKQPFWEGASHDSYYNRSS